MLSRYNVISPLSPFWGAPSNPLSASMNRLFQDFETAFARSAFTPPARRGRGPRVQLRDEGESISMLAELPGLKLEDVDLSIEGTTVTLKTTPRTAPVPEGFSALRRERQPSAVEWSFELPYAVDAASASATLDQGRLSVTLPKAPEAKPRTISVKAA
ncbi:MAG TPA: Hsp20/alpha crystallin family protein [Polyangiaceae bacterium]|nr:Hsp20/alpha crystallin family protein [Polyangiaceae bacterium]